MIDEFHEEKTCETKNIFETSTEVSKTASSL